MPTIHLTTFIAAPPARVFDLSRSIDLHKKSMSESSEMAVAGTISGLIELDETVTWKAKHLFKTRFLKTKITAMDRPFSFTDEQISDNFKSLQHEHFFKAIANGTIVIDLFHFEIPYGKAGEIFNKLFLIRYIRNVLEKRNLFIKSYAETEKWKFVLEK